MTVIKKAIDTYYEELKAMKPEGLAHIDEDCVTADPNQYYEPEDPGFPFSVEKDDGPNYTLEEEINGMFKGYEKSPTYLDEDYELISRREENLKRLEGYMYY